MTAANPACVECGADLAPDQEYCLECGARQRQPTGPSWKRPLIAAALALAVTALVFVLAYAHMRDDADRAAGREAARSGALTRSAATGRADGSGSGKPAPPVRLAAQKSP
jgi:hypothetical protein